MTQMLDIVPHLQVLTRNKSPHSVQSLHILVSSCNLVLLPFNVDHSTASRPFRCPRLIPPRLCLYGFHNALDTIEDGTFTWTRWWWKFSIGLGWGSAILGAPFAIYLHSSLLTDLQQPSFAQEYLCCAIRFRSHLSLSNLWSLHAGHVLPPPVWTPRTSVGILRIINVASMQSARSPRLLCRPPSRSHPCSFQGVVP